VLDHAGTLIQFINEANGGQNAALKAFAAASVPALAEQLKGAVALQLNSAGIASAEQGVPGGAWTLADLFSQAGVGTGSDTGTGSGTDATGGATGGSTTVADLSAPPPTGATGGSGSAASGSSAAGTPTTTPIAAPLFASAAVTDPNHAMPPVTATS